MYGLLEITEFEESHSKIAVRVPLPNLVSNLFGDSKISVAVVYGLSAITKTCKNDRQVSVCSSFFLLVSDVLTNTERRFVIFYGLL